MQIKRTEAALPITRTEESQTTDVKKAESIYSNSDSFKIEESKSFGEQNNISSTPYSQKPNDEIGDLFKKQAIAAHLGDSAIKATPSAVTAREEQVRNLKNESESAQSSLRAPQIDSSFANAKQAELTQDFANFKKVQDKADAKAQEKLINIDDLLRSSNNPTDVVIGQGFEGVTIDFGNPFHDEGSTDTPKESEKHEPLPTAEINRKQKDFTELFVSNRKQATSSVTEEQIRNLKNESESAQSLLRPPEIDLSLGNPKQTEFTEDLANFKKTKEEAETKAEQEKLRNAAEDLLGSGNNSPFTGQGSVDFGNPFQDDTSSESASKSQKDEPVAETIRKQQILTESLASTKDKLGRG